MALIPVWGLPFGVLRAIEAVEDADVELRERRFSELFLVAGTREIASVIAAINALGAKLRTETAQLLRRQGGDVSLLALLDSAPPALDDATITDVDDAVLLLNLAPEDIGVTIEELRRLNANEQQISVVARAHERGLVPPDFDTEGLRRFLAVYKANIVAGSRHRLAPYPGKITLLQSEERAAMAEHGPGNGWCKLALGGCDTWMRYIHRSGNAHGAHAAASSHCASRTAARMPI